MGAEEKALSIEGIREEEPDFNLKLKEWVGLDQENKHGEGILDNMYVDVRVKVHSVQEKQ